MARALILFLSLGFAMPALAQRNLYWNAFDVVAHLDAGGRLHVTETQTMVFSGEWNGGERRFDLRPRQTLSFDGMSRNDGFGWRPLTRDSRLDSIDDFAVVDSKTVRWRSRRPSDPPFADTKIQYELRYVLSGIVQKEGDEYRLDHDFAFKERDGLIVAFTLRLTLDPAWQTPELESTYTAGPMPPGKSFMLDLPLRHTGTGEVFTRDLSRPMAIRVAVSALLGFTALAIGWFFVRERARGRFVPLATAEVNEAWLRENVLKYPAEVVGAAWDETVGPPEVVALLARMTSEGKLESIAGEKASGGSSMTLRLKVDRATLAGHERTIVERLFFDGRGETSTDAVKAHYQSQGFNPAQEITSELEAKVEELVPPGKRARPSSFAGRTLFLGGVALLAIAWMIGDLSPAAIVAAIIVLVVALIGWLATLAFRMNVKMGRVAAAFCLIPALTIAAAAAAFLWFWVGTGDVELHPVTIAAVVSLALAFVTGLVNSMKSRQHREALAVRKRLAAAREFFRAELRKDEPAMRDEWYPWVLALELGKQVDDWSSRRPATTTSDDRDLSYRSSRSTSTRSWGSSPGGWSGFGGGRSGGAGASASWQTAAGGLAAGVASPRSSSGSSGGGSSSSGGSSRSSSSGGGGGGGW
jgi:uncharacterized membrane protein YgcG